MKSKYDFVTNSSSVSFIISDFRDKGGDIIVHFNASKEYNIVELTRGEVMSGNLSGDHGYCGKLTEKEQKEARSVLDMGGRVHYCIVMDERFMDFLETKKGITLETSGEY